MSKNETWRTRKYWRSVGGLLIEEFKAIPLNREGNTGRRLLDGVIVLGEKQRRQIGGKFDLKGKDIIVVQTKSNRLSMYLMGQALFSREILKRYKPKSIRTVAICGKGDPEMENLCKKNNIEVVVIPESKNPGQIMSKNDLIKLHKRRVCQLAVGASALRNQGAEGVVKTARDFFKKMKIQSFVTQNENQFQKRLDSETDKLLTNFPKRARNWGAARKAINLFLRDVLYNTYLNKYYSFYKVEKYLEVPLDSYTIKGIKEDSKTNSLPKWKGIKYLNLEYSKIFQNLAKDIAKRKGIARVHLDLLYWRNNKT